MVLTSNMKVMKNKSKKEKLAIYRRVLLASLLVVGASTVALAADASSAQPMMNDTGIAISLMSLIVLQLFIITAIADSIKNLAGNVDLWLKLDSTSKVKAKEETNDVEQVKEEPKVEVKVEIEATIEERIIVEEVSSQEEENAVEAGDSSEEQGEDDKSEEDESKGGAVISTIALLIFSLFSVELFAAGGSTSNEPLIVLSDNLFWVLISANVFLFGVMLYLLGTLKGLIKTLRGEEEALEDTKPFIDLTDAVPIEREAEIMMDHEYDGIRELDNNLPPWWVYMFYITMAFAVVYIVHYHITPIKIFENVAMIGPGVGQEKLYEIEMEEAQKAKEEYMARMSNLVDESNVELLTDGSALGKGADIFKANCTPCHGQAAEGNAIGPNLTDEYWLHGGGIKEVFTTIKYGVPVKGMREWQSQFSPSQLQQIASYILSLQGSNPANAKDPQGDLWKEEVSTEEAPSAEEPTEDSEVVAEETSTEENTDETQE